MRRFSKGVNYALLTALVSGISIFVNKFAVGSITPPLVFTSVKNAIVGVLIISLLLITVKRSKLKNLTPYQIKTLLAIGIIGGALPFYLFFTGISMIPAVNAAIIHKTLVFWIAILAYPLLKEKLSPKQLVGVLLLFAGNMFIGGFKGFTFSLGELFVFGATILWAVENIIAKKALDSVDPDIVTASRMGIGSLILLAASILFYPSELAGVFSLNSSQIFWLVLTAIALLAYVMTWYRALKHAPAVTVASVLVLSTLVTNFLTALFITNNFEIKLVVQSAIMLLGVIPFVQTNSENTVEIEAV